MKKAAKKFLAWMTALGFVLGSASAMEPAENGQIALIPLDASCMDTSKVPPELNVTLPFDGLVTFVQK